MQLVHIFFHTVWNMYKDDYWLIAPRPRRAINMFSCCAAWNQCHRDNIESFFCPLMPLPGWTLGRSNNAWLWSWLDLFTNRPNQIVPGSSIGVFILVKYFTFSNSNLNFKIKKTHYRSAHGGQRSSSVEKEQIFVKNKNIPLFCRMLNSPLAWSN